MRSQSVVLAVSQSILMDFVYETGILNPWRIDKERDNLITNLLF